MNKKIIVNVLSAVMIAAALIGLYTIGADKNEERSTYSDSKNDMPIMEIAKEQVWIDKKTGLRKS